MTPSLPGHMHLLWVGQERGPGDVPLVRREEQDVGAGTVHLVGLAGMDGLLLHRLNLQGVQLLVKHLDRTELAGLVKLLACFCSCKDRFLVSSKSRGMVCNVNEWCAMVPGELGERERGEGGGGREAKEGEGERRRRERGEGGGGREAKEGEGERRRRGWERGEGGGGRVRGKK